MFCVFSSLNLSSMRRPDILAAITTAAVILSGRIELDSLLRV